MVNWKLNILYLTRHLFQSLVGQGKNHLRYKLPNVISRNSQQKFVFVCLVFLVKKYFLSFCESETELTSRGLLFKRTGKVYVLIKLTVW